MPIIALDVNSNATAPTADRLFALLANMVRFAMTGLAMVFGITLWTK